MLCPLPLSNYPYVGRLGLQGEVSVATQGATDYLRISALMKNVLPTGADNLSYLCIVMTEFHSKSKS